EAYKALTFDDLLTDPTCAPLLEAMEEIAWTATQKKAIIFTKETYQPITSRIPLKERTKWATTLLNELGFLKPAGAFINPLQTDYYFIHLTFQEYFAARHLANLFKTSPKEAIDWLTRNKFDRRYEIVLNFTAGLLSSERDALDAFFNTLLAPPNSLAGIHELCLSVCCSEEVNPPLPSENYNTLLSRFLTLMQRQPVGSVVSYKHIYLTLNRAPRFFLTKTIKNHYLSQLNHLDRNIRFDAANALMMIKPNDLDVIHELVKHLNDTDSFVGWRAADAIGEIKPSDPSIIHQLVKLLADTNSNVRRSAAVALGKIKSNDLSVIQELTKLLHDTKSNVRRSAADALGKIKPSELSIFHELVNLLRDTDSDVGWSAVEALGKIKPSDLSVIQKLTELLSDTDKNVRRSAAFALSEIKPNQTKILAHLEKLSRAKGQGGCEEAWKVIGYLKKRMLVEGYLRAPVNKMERWRRLLVIHAEKGGSMIYVFKGELFFEEDGVLCSLPVDLTREDILGKMNFPELEEFF
ncbi:MAG: HEAT repeat domain-containing protein, partial [Chlamydiia bacterium]|nr:HEAT repeat domain-containing protein [Chlamydiia bacterium]